MRNRRGGINRRRWGLIVLVLCLGISFSLWRLKSNRTKFEFREVSKFTLSTNNYGYFKPVRSSGLGSKNLLIINACTTNINVFNNLYKKDLLKQDSRFDEYWDRYVYDLDNERAYLVSGHYLHHHAGSGNVLSVGSVFEQPLHTTLVGRINKELDKIKFVDWRFPVAVNQSFSGSQPVYFGRPGKRFKIEGVSVPARQGYAHGSPDGRYVFLPEFYKQNADKFGPWVVDMSNGAFLAVNNYIEKVPEIPIRDLSHGRPIIWASESELIIPLHSQRGPGFDADNDYVCILDMDSQSCQLLLSPEIVHKIFKRHGVEDEDYRWYYSGQEEDDHIFTLSTWRGPQFEDISVGVNMTTLESRLNEKSNFGRHPINRYPIHHEDNIFIERVKGKNEEGYIIRNQRSGKIVWSLDQKARNGEHVEIRILKNSLILSWAQMVWRCELNGGNPVPLIPFDCPMSCWNEIVSPMSVPESSDTDSNNSYYNKGKSY